MRKRFAEDELLGSFRIKQKPALRIDFKPTPPELVDEMIKELEPVLEALNEQTLTTSNLSLNWDISGLEDSVHLPTEEELKALLAFEPMKEDVVEVPEITRTQRYQKMLELLERVEALTHSASKDASPEDHQEPMRPDLIEPELATTTANTQDAFSNTSGEDHEMRSRAESMSFNSDRPAASPEQTPPNHPEAQNDIKLNLDQVEFQERLIRILNENYGDLGEVQPQNLKARLIEILNEEYADDEDDEAEAAEEDTFDVEEAVTAADSVQAEGDEAAPFSAAYSEDPLLKDTVLRAFESSAALRQSQASETSSEALSQAEPLKTEAGFLSDAYNHNMPESGISDRFSRNVTERTFKRPQVPLNEFQYVTSFQEVTEEAADVEGLQAEPAVQVVPESEPEPSGMSTFERDSMELKPETESSDLGDAAEAFEAISTPSEDSTSATERSDLFSESKETAPRILEKEIPVHFRDEAHPWLKELQSEGLPESPDVTMAEPPREMPREERKTVQEKPFSPEPQDIGEKVIAEEHLAARASGGLRPQSERHISVEEWSFVMDTMKEQIEYLKKQLEIKDHQLQNKDELIRNFQILLKNEQDKFLKLEHKMDDVVAQVEERATKKGFFSRFRKR